MKAACKKSFEILCSFAEKLNRACGTNFKKADREGLPVMVDEKTGFMLSRSISGVYQFEDTRLFKSLKRVIEDKELKEMHIRNSNIKEFYRSVKWEVKFLRWVRGEKQ